MIARDPLREVYACALAAIIDADPTSHTARIAYAAVTEGRFVIEAAKSRFGGQDDDMAAWDRAAEACDYVRKVAL